MAKKRKSKNIQDKAAKKSGLADLFNEIEEAKKDLDGVSRENVLNKESISKLENAIDSVASEIEALKEENRSLKEAASQRVATSTPGPENKHEMSTIIGRAMEAKGKGSEDSIRGWLRDSLEEERRKTEGLESKILSLEEKLKKNNNHDKFHHNFLDLYGRRHCNILHRIRVFDQGFADG